MAGYHTDELELASDFQPFEGEANFGPPITREVVGGAHIAPHAITIDTEGRFVLVDWYEGLPRHGKPGKRSIRFPHGLIRHGEKYEDCAARLVEAQMGLSASRCRVVHVYSYLDEANHWHMEPIILTYVTGAEEHWSDRELVRCPARPALPEGSAWVGKPPFAETFAEFIAPLL